MDICNKVLSKAPISWTDVQKQLLNVMQTRTTNLTTSLSSNYGSSISSASSTLGLAINKVQVKQCTDLLIKHIKNLSQAQVIDQLNNFAQSCNLNVYTTPSEDDPTTVNAFLSHDDFYFEISIKLNGEIIDVKFSLFSEQAKKNNLLKDMFRTWNWDSLYKHIDGIKNNFILNNTNDSQIKTNAYKSIQCLEKDLNTLYQIELKYLDKYYNYLTTTNTTSTTSSVNAKIDNTNNKNSINLNSNESKYIDSLFNKTPIGIFKKSELGESMRLYYYLSPIDLIQYFKTISSCSTTTITNTSTSQLEIDNLIKNNIGSYLTISLNSNKQHQMQQNDMIYYKLPDSSLLLLNENDESKWNSYLEQYIHQTTINSNLNLEKNPLFGDFNKQNNVGHFEIPGTFQIKLNKPIIMCKSTLNELQTKLAVETINLEQAKLTPYFELLAKTEINSKILNDAYSVQLPDENQVYYITESDDYNFMGILVDKILFTKPQDLLIIIELLRKQLLFNELLFSCMKNIMCSSAINIQQTNTSTTNTKSCYDNNNNNSTNVRILEISLISSFVLSIIMQHPIKLCYTTIEIDLTANNIETKFRDHNDLHNPLIINQVIQRCHSIPITIRAILMKYKQNNSYLSNNKNKSNNNNNSSDDNGHYNNSNNNHHNGYNSNNDNNDNNGNQTNGNNKNHLNQNYNNYNDDDRMIDTNQNISYDSHHDSETVFGIHKKCSFKRNRVNENNNIDTPEHNIQNNSVCLVAFSQESIESDSIYETNENNENKPFVNNTTENFQTPNRYAKNVKLQANTLTYDCLAISNKKRKVSSSDELIQSTSTPNANTTNSNLPPSAKRKMTSQQPQDLKRHTSLIESSSNLDISNDNNNNSSIISTSSINKTKPTSQTPSNTNNPNKKLKLKNSISSVDISANSTSSPNQNINKSSSKSENTTNKKDSSLTPSTSSNKTNLIKKDSTSSASPSSSSGVLLNSNKITSASSTTTKLTNSTNKNINSANNNQQLKKSQSTKQLNDNSATSSSKQNTSLNNSNSIKVKSITDDGMKIKISKDKLKSNANSSLLNKSTEVALKQSNNSLFTSPNTNNNGSSSSINTSSGSVIQNLSSNLIKDNTNRTPSPLPLSSSPATSLSSTPNSLTTASQDDSNTNDNNDQLSTSTLPKYEPPSKQLSNSNKTTKNKDSVYNTKPTSAPLSSSLNSTSNLKPNTPPLLTSSTNSLASFALGLSSSFKASNFKIPIKSKTQTSPENKNDNEDNAKSSSSSSSSTLPPSTSSVPSNSNSSRTSSADSSQSNNKSLTVSDQSNKQTGNQINNSKQARSSSISMPPPSSTSLSSSSSNSNNRNNNNSSPKWQANYPGNISPRYSNNYDQTTSPMSLLPSNKSSNSSNQQKSNTNNNSSNSNINNKHNMQRSSSAGNRPLTPIPSQFSNNPSQSSNSRNKPLAPPPVPLLSQPISLIPTTSQSSTKSIPSLMSFSSFSTKDSLMTPSSPINEQNNAINQEVKIIKDSRTAQSPPCSSSSSASSIPQPPDSPVCESAPLVVPKLIPLERNLPPPLMSTTPNDLFSRSSSNRPGPSSASSSSSLSRSRSKGVDIASPDRVTNSEEEDDNLVIDLIQSSKSTSYASRHLINSSSSSNSLSSTSRNIKSPCILEEDLVNNEAIIS